MRHGANLLDRPSCVAVFALSSCPHPDPCENSSFRQGRAYFSGKSVADSTAASQAPRTRLHKGPAQNADAWTIKAAGIRDVCGTSACACQALGGPHSRAGLMPNGAKLHATEQVWNVHEVRQMTQNALVFGQHEYHVLQNLPLDHKRHMLEVACRAVGPGHWSTR